MNNNQDASNKKKPITNDQLSKEIKTIIAKITKLPIEKILDDSNLFADLGIESLAGVEIFAAIDKKYNLNIPEEKVKDVTSVADLVDLIQIMLKQ
ncbi:MAG: acyl carrier protein [Candidatus Margulisiibacteriota bacterium]